MYVLQVTTIFLYACIPVKPLENDHEKLENYGHCSGFPGGGGEHEAAVQQPHGQGQRHGRGRQARHRSSPDCQGRQLYAMWMRYSRVVRASDSQCRTRNCPGFDPSILRNLRGGRRSSVEYRT
jgi:hypothetical protein